jgi:methyl-accepting chemotaxis protein
MSVTRRKNFLIKTKFQLKYTLLTLGIFALIILVSGMGIYLGMWASIIENFSKFKVSEELETARRIAAYEDARFQKGDWRLQKVFREAELLSQRQKEALKEASQAVNRSLLPKLGLLVFILFIGGIFLSHKIAGPMYRIERSAEAIKNGNLNVSFGTRKGDEMKKAALKLDEMRDSLLADISQVKTAGTSLKGCEEEIKKALPEKKKEEVKEALRILEKIISKYKT